LSMSAHLEYATIAFKPNRPPSLPKISISDIARRPSRSR
jgi:hypothetical protein